MDEPAADQKPPLLALVCTLLFATGVISLLAMLPAAAGINTALSVWLGGGIAIVGLVSFTRRSLRRDPTGASAQQLLADVVGAMLLKFALVGLLIGAAIRFWAQLDALAMLLAFALVSLLGSLLGSWMLLDERSAPASNRRDEPGKANRH